MLKRHGQKRWWKKFAISDINEQPRSFNSRPCIVYTHFVKNGNSKLPNVSAATRSRFQEYTVYFYSRANKFQELSSSDRRCQKSLDKTGNRENGLVHLLRTRVLAVTRDTFTDIYKSSNRTRSLKHIDTYIYTYTYIHAQRHLVQEVNIHQTKS